MQLVSDEFLQSFGMTAIHFLLPGFIIRGRKGLALLVANMVDDFILAGTDEALYWFSKRINPRFQLGTEAYALELIRSNGAIIQQDQRRSIKASMEEFAFSLKPLQIAKERRKQNDAPVSPECSNTVSTHIIYPPR